MELASYPFQLLRRYFAALLVPLIAIAFLIVASMVTTQTDVNSTFAIVGSHFNQNITTSATDFTKYAKIGGNGLFPIMRLGGIANNISFTTAFANQQQALDTVIVFLTIFLGYLTYAMVSRLVYEHKNNSEISFWGWKGINPATTALSLIGAFVVVFFSALSLSGFELALLLNFGVFFLIAIPIAATGETVGESFYWAFKFLQFHLDSLVTMYLLCAGIAIATPIGLLLIFLFPLSVIQPSAVPAFNLAISLLGVSFALYYQFAVCAKEVFDNAKTTPIVKPSGFKKIGKRIK